MTNKTNKKKKNKPQEDKHATTYTQKVRKQINRQQHGMHAHNVNNFMNRNYSSLVTGQEMKV